MAEAAAIGWVVSPIIEAMVAKAVSYVEDQYYSWHKDVDDDLRELEQALTKIQAAVTAAQHKQTRDNPNLERWLHQIKDAVHDADDVLDEFEYRCMKAQAERAGGKVSRIVSSSLAFGKRLIGVDEFRTTLKKMLRVLDSVGGSISALLQVVGSEHATVHHQGTEIEPSRETGSIPPQNEIFGREKEKEEIVGLLLKPVDDPESSNRKCIPVISITGFGGVGKTTLAQLVYHDSRIVNHFDTRLWVCVSDRFDEIRLTRSMVESVSRPDQTYGDFKYLNALQKKLQNLVESKRFLLVLDDVWLDEERKIWENNEMWAKVFAPLNQATVGSKILVTTRMDVVAEMFEATDRIPLGGLESAEYWSLFKHCAFSKEKDENPALEAIGRQIAARLHGSPLAAKAIGTLLKKKSAIKEWKEILKRETLDDIASILKLSYQCLPDHLKQYFIYCSVFPKDWQFKPEKLVLLWIAQNYIQVSDTNDRPMTDIGMDYFNELLSRSFLKKIDRDSRICYVIHDLIHDMIQFVAKDECFRIDGRKQGTIKNNIQHLGVVFSWKIPFDFKIQLGRISNLKKLRTLIFFDREWMNVSGSPLLGMLKKTKSLRVLDCGGLTGFQEFPTALGHLLHLRYLNLGRNCFKIFPESLCGLYHLQVLALNQQLQLSKSIFRLINFGHLTHFDVEGLEFRVEKKKGHGIGVLKGGMKLVFQRDLCIKNLEKVARKKEAIKADLVANQYLHGLQLEWGSSDRINRDDASEEIAQALKPHRNLKELSIRGFGGVRSPSWLEMKWLINVQIIHLTDCWNLEVLPPLGHLPLLKQLRIIRTHTVKRIDSGFYGCNDNEDEGRVRVGFPSLEELELDDMPEWSEWLGVGFPVFPCLRALNVFRCPKLVSLPECELPSLVSLNVDFWTQLPRLPSLRYLTIDDCRSEACSEVTLPPSLERLKISASVVSDASLSRGLQGLTLLSELNIWGCSRLTSLPPAQVLHSLTALRELHISSCENLTSLGGLHALNALKYLIVGNCPGVKSLPEGLPASIERLTLLWGCDPSLKQQIREKKGPEWDKVAHIPYVETFYRCSSEYSVHNYLCK